MDTRVDKLINAISKLRDLKISLETQRDMRDAINGIFNTDAKCVNFIYTMNTDKLPFGVVVFPRLKQKEVVDLFIVGNPIRIMEYDVELDSKLFDYGLDDEEVATILIFNIYHMIKDTKPTEVVKYAIDNMIAREPSTIDVECSMYYTPVLELGLVDALNKLSSFLYLDDEIQSDPFLDELELYNFKLIQDKIYRQIPGCENETLRSPKLTMLEWALRSYKNIEYERSAIGHLLDKCKAITASELYRNKFNLIINCVNSVYPMFGVADALDKNKLINEAAGRPGLLARLKYDGLRDIESDLYEFQIRAKNAETENDVMYALRQINSRLAILDDYIRSYPDDPDIQRWIDVKMMYLDIRSELAKKRLHKKAYGIFIDYDKVFRQDSDNDSNYTQY